MKKKEALLVKGETKTLQSCIKEEEEAANRLEFLEQQRRDTVLACFPGAQELPSLSDVLAAAPEDQMQSIEEAAMKLIESLKSVVHTNRAVAELVQISIDYANFHINLLGTDPVSDSIYGKSGSTNNSEPTVRGIINRQA